MRYFIVRLCVYYLLLTAVGCVLAVVYSGTLDYGAWSQRVRTMVVLGPLAVMALVFWIDGL